MRALPAESVGATNVRRVQRDHRIRFAIRPGLRPARDDFLRRARHGAGRAEIRRRLIEAGSATRRLVRAGFVAGIASASERFGCVMPSGTRSGALSARPGKARRSRRTSASEPPQAASNGRDKAKSHLSLRSAQGKFNRKVHEATVTHFGTTANAPSDAQAVVPRGGAHLTPSLCHSSTRPAAQSAPKLRRAGGERGASMGDDGRADSARIASGFRTGLRGNRRSGSPAPRPSCTIMAQRPRAPARANPRRSGAHRCKRARPRRRGRAAVALVRESAAARRSHLHRHCAAGHVLRLRSAGPPNPLIVRFDASAAPLERAGHTVEPQQAGISMSPQLAGQWTWDDDKRPALPARERLAGRPALRSLAGAQGLRRRARAPAGLRLRVRRAGVRRESRGDGVPPGPGRRREQEGRW